MKKLIFLGLIAGLYGDVYAQEPAEKKPAENALYAVRTTTATSTIKSIITGVQETDPAHIKRISKTFPAGQGDKINLNNQFGSINVKVWNRKEVKIDVLISASGDNEKDTQNLLDLVDIDAGKVGDQISCKTTIGSEHSWSGRNKTRNISVNYIVYLPATNALTLSQQFGNVTMGDFSGPLSAKVQYGDFNAGTLSDDNIYVHVQYGKTNIGELNKAVIKQQYGSGLIIGTAGELDLIAQYASVSITTIKRNASIKQQYGSGLKIGSVNNLDLSVQYANANVGTIRGTAVIKQQYNSLAIGSVGKLDLRSQYAGVMIGTLKGDGTFKTSYNHFTIDEITTGCKDLQIDADYADVTLNFAEGYSAEFNVEKSYGGFRYGANVRATIAGDSEDKRNSSTKNYSGKIGNGGSGSVTIKADYGSVVFK